MLGMLVELNSEEFRLQTRRGLYNPGFRHVLIHECVHASSEIKIIDVNIGRAYGAYGKIGAIKNVKRGSALQNAENYVYAFGLGENQ
jgi:hypothetical protein